VCVRGWGGGTCNEYSEIERVNESVGKCEHCMRDVRAYVCGGEGGGGGRGVPIAESTASIMHLCSCFSGCILLFQERTAATE
jgi:hypothetical protein